MKMSTKKKPTKEHEKINTAINPPRKKNPDLKLSQNMKRKKIKHNIPPPPQKMSFKKIKSKPLESKKKKYPKMISQENGRRLRRKW